MPQTPSIQPQLLTDVTHFVSDDIVSVRLNGNISIHQIFKVVSTPTTGVGFEAFLTVTYNVAPTVATEITKVELLDASGKALTSSDVYVPVGSDGIQMKHIIPVKEGT